MPTLSPILLDGTNPVAACASPNESRTQPPNSQGKWDETVKSGTRYPLSRTNRQRAYQTDAIPSANRLALRSGPLIPLALFS